jgi:DNA-directed RNA polymerase sigma subunit (sigma70/sigma32)
MPAKYARAESHMYEKDAHKTLKEIAIDFEVTRERIRQIETMALKKLRKKLAAKGIKGIEDLL